MTLESVLSHDAVTAALLDVTHQVLKNTNIGKYQTDPRNKELHKQ